MTKQTEVYQCNVCGRKTTVPYNKKGLSVLLHCIITSKCLGKLNKVTNQLDINNTPNMTPEISGVRDWFQRQVLYNHTQITPATTWIINHKLNNNPTYDVMVDTGDGLLVPSHPIVTIIDYNTSKLTFNTKTFGIAQAIALSSQNTYITPTTTVAPTLQQLTIPGGLLTIATRDTSSTIQLNTQWQTNPLLNLQYTGINLTPSAHSPWSNSNKIYINGVIYVIRTVNILQDSNNGSNFISGGISNGCSFTISITNKSDILILLASTPYTTVDKIYDKYVNINSATDLTKSLLTYSNGLLYADPSIVKTVYPHIKVV